MFIELTLFEGGKSVFINSRHILKVMARNGADDTPGSVVFLMKDSNINVKETTDIIMKKLKAVA